VRITARNATCPVDARTSFVQFRRSEAGFRRGRYEALFSFGVGIFLIAWVSAIIIRYRRNYLYSLYTRFLFLSLSLSLSRWFFFVLSPNNHHTVSFVIRATSRSEQLQQRYIAARRSRAKVACREKGGREDGKPERGNGELRARARAPFGSARAGRSTVDD